MLQPHDAFALAERRKRLIILACLWVAIAVVLITFRSVVMPFAGAALIAYLVQPLVARITRVQLRGQPIPRWVAILLIYALFFVLVYLFFIALVPQLYREIARISRDGLAFANSLTPEYLQSAGPAGGGVAGHLRHPHCPVRSGAWRERTASGTHFSFAVDLGQLLNDSVARLSVLAQENLGNIVSVSRNIIGGVLAGVFMLFFILMVGAFFSIDAQAIRHYVGTLIPPEYSSDARILADRLDRSLSGVVRGQVTICIVNGIAHRHWPAASSG